MSLKIVLTIRSKYQFKKRVQCDADEGWIFLAHVKNHKVQTYLHHTALCLTVSMVLAVALDQITGREREFAM